MSQHIRKDEGHRRSRGARLWGALALVPAVLLVLAAAMPAAHASPGTDLGDYRVVDPSQVYYGNPRLVRLPCVISGDVVYRSIPEYREILEQGLTDKDVRYHFLMKKASERFGKAVKDMARALGHDLVAEQGSVVPARDLVPDPTDRTTEVISRLP